MKTITLVWILLHSYHPLNGEHAGGLVMEEYLGTPFASQEECEAQGEQILESDRIYFPEEADHKTSRFTCYPQDLAYTLRKYQEKLRNEQETF